MLGDIFSAVCVYFLYKEIFKEKGFSSESNSWAPQNTRGNFYIDDDNNE